jgi:hypothetical protein
MTLENFIYESAEEIVNGNYDSVKDDPDYFVKEKDVISVCISYINMIKVD